MRPWGRTSSRFVGSRKEVSSPTVDFRVRNLRIGSAMPLDESDTAEAGPDPRSGRADARPVIHLASSDGGHLHLMSKVRSALEEYRVVWVTQDSERSRTLDRSVDSVELLPRYDRHLVKGKLLSNIASSARIVRETEPRVVITAGSGLIVPFCAMARARGAKIVFAETAARVHGPSASGRVLSRLADEVIVQWESMLEVYKGSSLCRPTVFEDIREEPEIPGVGTFVAVGTMNRSYHRLLEAIDDAAERGVLPQPIFAQSGVSKYEPRHFEMRPWLTPDEIDHRLRTSRVVVSHGGTGLISGALQRGRRPIVLPRRESLGEHFDNHQEEVTEALGSMGLAVPFETTIEHEHVAAATRPLDLSELRLPATRVEEAVCAAVERFVGATRPRIREMA